MASLVLKPIQMKRRISSLNVHRIWNEILCMGETNSGVEMVKLAKALLESHETLSQDQWTAEICYAIQDGLLTSAERVGENGQALTIVGRPTSELSIIETSYRDWFCFKCHKHGDLVGCSDCSKAYHLECLSKDWPTVTYGVMDRRCPSCELIYNKRSMAKIPDTQTLNELLVFLTKGVTDWEIPILNEAVGVDWARAINCLDSEAWRFSYLVHTPMDADMILLKASRGGYSSLEEFQVDCETLAHNLGVFFGVEILKKTRIGHDFLSTVLHGIEEIKMCHDCFFHSNKKEDHWVCKPCTVSHEVVWAKIRGYSAWPAKVLRRFNGKCEVRFFGEPHSRSVLPNSRVQPITASVKHSRRSKALQEAIAELKMYQNQTVTG